MFFFFKQKTAYEMRISDWSSDVCSSDLGYTAVVYAFRNSRDAFKGRAASGKWPPIPQIPELATRGAIMWNAFVEGLDARLGETEWIAGGGYKIGRASCRERRCQSG